MASDPFVYPGTDVLRNKKGLCDLARLEPFEAQVTAVRIAQLVDAPVHGNFDLDHLKALHRHIFQDVYPWAPPSASLTGHIRVFEERMNAEKKPPPKVGETPAPEPDDTPRPKQGPKP